MSTMMPLNQTGQRDALPAVLTLHTYIQHMCGSAWQLFQSARTLLRVAVKEKKEGGKDVYGWQLYVEQNSCVDGRERKQTVTATGAEVADVCAHGEFVTHLKKSNNGWFKT